jgi:hypothetical protein
MLVIFLELDLGVMDICAFLSICRVYWVAWPDIADGSRRAKSTYLFFQMSLHTDFLTWLIIGVLIGSAYNMPVP